MSYYNEIAEQWHETTGFEGGAFKKLVLNDILLRKLPPINNCAILELGSGNGYFMPMVLRHFAGQVPASITITDQSERQLEIAKRHFEIPNATYQVLDVCDPFPFVGEQFDIVLASMLFNEVSSAGFRNGLRESRRVLKKEGLFLMAVTHPDFNHSLRKRALIKSTPEGGLTMPGSGSLRLPVVMRTLAAYESSLQKAGFDYESEEGYATPEVMDLQAGLRNTWKIPVSLVFDCRKSG
jgi:SAM-dependent methyltransferase